MGLSRPLTKAAQAAANSSNARKETSVTLGEALARWETHLRSSDRIGSTRTVDAYLYGLSKLIDHLGSQYELHAITAEDIESLMASLKAGGMSPGGRAVVFRPIRTFLGWCVKRELLAASPAEHVDAPKVPDRPIEFVTDEEWSRILATTSTRSRWAFRHRRDRAILLLLATTGARLSEVAGLKVGDVDLAAREVSVLGKGSKPRTLPILPDVLDALKTYLQLERPRSPFSSATDALWIGPKGVLTDNGIAQMIRERGKAAGVKRGVHAHELRHRFIAKALRAGMPGPLVQSLAGQTTPSLLNRYGAHTRAQDAMDMLRAMAAKGAAA